MTPDSETAAGHLPLHEATHHLLRITSLHSTMRPLLTAFLSEALRLTGCRAGGIRLLQDDGTMPYRVSDGLGPAFLKMESSVPVSSETHLCARIVSGKMANLPGWRSQGLSYVADQDADGADQPGAPECRGCGRPGHRTVAMIPIRLGHRVLGVLHIAADQPELVPPGILETLERAAAQLGTAIQRIRAEEALTESEARYRDLFDNAGDSIIIRDLDGNIVEANRAAAELTGYSSSELRTKNIRDLLTEDAFKLAMGRQSSLGVGAGGTARSELEMVRKDGTQLFIESTTRLIERNGRVVGVEAMIRDITGRRRMEKELEESSKNFRAIAEQSSQGIMVMGFRGRYVYANGAAAEITGYSVEDLLEMNVRQLTHPDEHYKIDERSARRHAGQVNPRNYETVFVTREGRKLPVELTIARTLWNGHPAVIVIFRDIVEQKRLRIYASEVIKAQEEERKRIARELHDDTVQSLAALSLDIQAIIKKCKPSDPVLLRLDDIRRKTNSIIDGVRGFCYELRPDVLDQLGLITALETLAHDLSRDGLVRAHVEVTGFERRLAPDLELTLYRVAQEAIQNVRKHAGASHVTVAVEFFLDTITLSVSDDGAGFEMPHNLSELAAAGQFGLVGMEERVKLFDGKLSVQSAPGKGTTVTADVAG